MSCLSKVSLLAVIGLTVPFLITGCAGLSTGTIEDLLSISGPLDENTVVAGLKEALEVGTERSVASTSNIDGFLGNELIRIGLPDEYGKAAGLLRTAGFGSHVDELEVVMNRAAEQASGQARDVFWDAIKKMTIGDAFAILNGADDAATQYFRAQTEPELRARFQPIVTQQMESVGLYRMHNEVLGYARSVPLLEVPTVDLDTYVTDKALMGLFTVLAEEELKIREDPAARTTALLKRVFGRKEKG